MAAGILPKPGSETGPCELECKHRDCAATRRDASSPCGYCGVPIGYETRFYAADGGLVHATCGALRTFGRPFANQRQASVYVSLREDGSLYMLNYKTDGSLLEVLPTYETIEDVQLRNANLGHKWFDPSNMRWFGSRVHATVYPARDGTAYFVSSERDSYPDGAWGGRRRYSVRVAWPDGSVHTASEFGEFGTGREAHSRARELAMLRDGAI